ncbi:hypothetical protein SAMN05444162_4912 [Paenibacillaceae bacterium GAS479]|nr:hypothetical protein SAMN05444162_4912 [Paenibacillaceae bacterium GAS479]
MGRPALVWPINENVIVLHCTTRLIVLLHIHLMLKKRESNEKATLFCFFALTVTSKQVYNNSITEACKFQITNRGEPL